MADRLRRLSPGFDHLLAVTLLLVVATILLGVATRSTGAGLACDANWPLCDGGILNLFPATMPSFFEWIHRVVAMVAGLFIVATAWLAFRRPAVGRWVAGAIVAGAVLTPIQVVLGRETVLTYVPGVLELHFWAAMVIFVLFGAAAAVRWAGRFGPEHVRWALLVAAGLVPLHVALSPIVVSQYTPAVQTVQSAVILGLLGAVILVAVVGVREYVDQRVRSGLSSVIMLTVALLVMSRQSVMTLSPTVDTVYLLVAIGLAAACLSTAWVSRGRQLDGPAPV